jgi:5-methylcytosine-specific restriction endonuclease McrA
MALTSSLKGTGSTTQWRKIRDRIIKRDGVCQQCGSDEKLTVDHIIPRRLGGNDSFDNLQVLCQKCNYSKGGRFFFQPPTPKPPLFIFTPKTETKIHDQD